MPMLLFHAFRRDSIAQSMGVLRDGPQVSPRVTETNQLELHLNITPPSVYCYLGRTLAIFGDFAFALHPKVSVPGTMSPFDTGGLVRKCRPVCTWEEARKREFLSAYSWPTEQHDEVLAAYPGSTLAHAERYLDIGKKPEVAGPHHVWRDRVEADIWALDDDWRAWTWEGRWGTRLPVAEALVAWSCSPAWWPVIVDWAENSATEDEFAAFSSLADKYVSGGIPALVQSLRNAQASP